MKTVLHRLSQPVPLFLLLGALIFVLDHWWTARSAEVVVTGTDVARIAAQWQAQMGSEPTPAELANLVDAWVAEELMVREARTMGLADGDTIVRRRLVQKLQFLTDDQTGAPDEADLQAWYQRHSGRYQHPARVSFRQVVFSRDRHPDPAAAARAALAELVAGSPSGDPSMLPRKMVLEPVDRVAVQFGQAFAETLPALPGGSWQGPVLSPYGAHLVWLEELAAARPMAFAEARQQVHADLVLDRQRAARAALLARLRAATRVRWLEGLAPPAGA